VEGHYLERRNTKEEPESRRRIFNEQELFEPVKAEGKWAFKDCFGRFIVAGKDSSQLKTVETYEGISEFGHFTIVEQGARQ